MDSAAISPVVIRTQHIHYRHRTPKRVRTIYLKHLVYYCRTYGGITHRRSHAWACHAAFQDLSSVAFQNQPGRFPGPLPSFSLHKLAFVKTILLLIQTTLLQ